MRFSAAFIGEQHHEHDDPDARLQHQDSDEADPQIQRLRDFMVGNSMGNWSPTKAKIKTTYDYGLKGQEVAIWWPGRTNKGDCNNVRDESRGCWFRSRLLSDPGCLLDQRCLHFAAHDGEPTLTYTCPTWVKNMDGTSSKLPDRWQACPTKFNLARLDSGIPQEFKQAMSQTCGFTVEEHSLFGSWMGGTLAESMKFKIAGTGLAELRVDIESQPNLSVEEQANGGVGQHMSEEHVMTGSSQPGMVPHSKVKKMSGTLQKDGDFFRGELVDEQESPLGKEIAIQLSENGTIVTYIRQQGSTDWGLPVEAIKEIPTAEGTAQGAPCMFPFEHEGVPQHECITAGRGRPWCKTDLSGNWGFCKDQVPHKMKEVIGTHGGSSVSSGPRCLLPFDHNGISYDTCAVLSDLAKDSPACITDSKGSWGYCNCEVASGAKGEVQTHGGTANGASCKFPFTHEGKEFNACTDLGHGAPACLTDDSGSWGYCNCKKPLAFMGPLMQDAQEVAEQAQQQAIDEGAKDSGALTANIKPTHYRCTGSTTGEDDAKLLFDIHHNAWYRCTQKFRCEPFDIRSIHEQTGQTCGEHHCGKHEFCFEHRVTSKRSTYECVASANVFLLGDGDDAAKFMMPEAFLALGTLSGMGRRGPSFRSKRSRFAGCFL